jgi:hypothetical protein
VAALAAHGAPYQRVLQEDGEPRARDALAFPLLQFRQTASDLEDQPGNGRWRHEPPLGNEMKDVVEMLEAWEAARDRMLSTSDSELRQ